MNGDEPQRNSKELPGFGKVQSRTEKAPKCGATATVNSKNRR